MITEVCSQCGEEQEISNCGQYCRNCGKFIIPCSQCDIDNVKCSECPFFKLSGIAEIIYATKIENENAEFGISYNKLIGSFRKIERILEK